MAIYKSGRPCKFNPSSGVGHQPPQQPGEYRIRNGTGELVYVGETCNLRRRMQEHIHTGKLPVCAGGTSTLEFQVADGRSTSSTRREHERQKIAQHAPLLNRSGGGEGRPAEK
ncbi:MAG: GIY-YIG nuclease family protein [Oscillospiraceae bacterium]